MQSGDNLHQSIKAMLIERFSKHPLESRLPSVRELAAELDVAYLTVNGVMKELAWEGYVKRVPRKGTFLASRERTVQKDHQTGTNPLKTIIFAYANYFSYASWIRLHYAEERAVKNRMALLEFKMNPETTYDGLRDLVKDRGDVYGVVIIPIPGTVTRAEFSLFDELQVPVVLLAPSEYVSLGQHVWSVTTDWYRAGYLQAQHLLAKGHEQLAFVQHEPTDPQRQSALLKGMRQAVREAGGQRKDLLIASSGARAWADSRIASYQITRDLLQKGKVTAAMFESFRGVQGAMRAMREQSLSVPDDFGLVSIGRGNGDEEFFNPPITTVDPQPEIELAMVFRCLSETEQYNVKSLTVEPVLRDRQSVAAKDAVEA